MLPEVRMARITDAIELHRKKKLSCVEAGALLGMSERHFRRLRGAYEERGAEGIIDRRRGRTSGRRGGAGGRRAGGRAWTRLHGWSRNSTPATSISPPSHRQALVWGDFCQGAGSGRLTSLLV